MTCSHRHGLRPFSLGRVLLLGLSVALACPGAGARPLPGLVIDGVDLDRPGGAKVWIPASVGASVWAPGIGGGLRGPVGSDIGGGSTLAGTLGVQYGSWRGEVLVLDLQSSLESGLVVEGQAFAPGTRLEQSQFALRVSREAWRFANPWGLYHLDVGVRVDSLDRTLGTGVGPGGTANPQVPMLEARLFTRRNVGGAFGIHTVASYASGRGLRSRGNAMEFQGFFNYHMMSHRDGTHDLALGFRYLKDTVVFLSDVGAPSTRSVLTHLGPEFSYAFRF